MSRGHAQLLWRRSARGADLAVEPRRITGLIGPNGAGKTTLFNCISGLVPADAGRVVFDGHDITRWRPDRISGAGLVRTFQIARGFPRLTVLENLLLYGAAPAGRGAGAALLRPRAMLQRETRARPARARGRGAAQPRARCSTAGRRALGRTEEAARDRPRADGRAAAAAARRAGRRRQPDARARDRRAPRALVAEGLTILLIEHHMDTISRLCDHVVVMAEGRKLAEGSFAAVAADTRCRRPIWAGGDGPPDACPASLPATAPPTRSSKASTSPSRTGEIVCVIGPNGAGKSTLLKTIAGLLQPSQGAIDAARRRRSRGLPPREIARLGVAYVPQEHNIFPTMSVRENLEIGGYVDPARTPARIGRVFERFPMLARKRRHAARTLSGGERQILAMAMALMVEPSLLLLDEPSAGLSPVAAERCSRPSWRSTARASRSRWWSRTRSRRSRSRTAPTCWSTAATPHRPGARARRRPRHPAALPWRLIDACRGDETWRAQHDLTTAATLQGAGGAGSRGVCASGVVRAQGAPIQLGVLTPLTGAGGSDGPRMLKAMQAVADEVNAAGGVLGRQIQLDRRGRPDQSRSGGARGAQADRRLQGAGRSWAPGPRR